MKNFSCGIIIGKLVKPRKIVWLTLSQEDSWRNEKYMQVLLFLNIYTGQWSMWVLTCGIIWGHEMFHMTVVKNSSYPQSKLGGKTNNSAQQAEMENHFKTTAQWKWSESIVFYMPCPGSGQFPLYPAGGSICTVAYTKLWNMPQVEHVLED